MRHKVQGIVTDSNSCSQWIFLKLIHGGITPETVGVSCRKGLRRFGNCSDGLQKFPIDIQHTGTKCEDVRMHRLEMLRVIY